MSAEQSRNVILRINDELFECNGFVDAHPGEGISDIYLRQWRNKNVSAEFDQFHYDEEPEEMLASARKLVYDPQTKIRYVGKAWFTADKRLPKYFRVFAGGDEAARQFLQQTKSDGEDDELFCVTAVFPPSKETESQYWLYKTNKKDQVDRVTLTRGASNWTADSGAVAESLEQLIEKETINMKGLGC